MVGGPALGLPRFDVVVYRPSEGVSLSVAACASRLTIVSGAVSDIRSGVISPNLLSFFFQTRQSYFLSKKSTPWPLATPWWGRCVKASSWVQVEILSWSSGMRLPGCYPARCSSELTAALPKFCRSRDPAKPCFIVPVCGNRLPSLMIFLFLLLIVCFLIFWVFLLVLWGLFFFFICFVVVFSYFFFISFYFIYYYSARRQHILFRSLCSTVEVPETV